MDRRKFLHQTGHVALGATLVGTGVRAALAANKSSYATAELAQFDAVGQSDLFKAGEVSASDLVDAAIERIELLNPKLNCVIYEAFNHARKQARNASASDGPFAGVPYLLKGHDGREGFPQFNCSTLDQDTPSPSSGADAKAAESLGLIAVGKTTVPEFAVLTSTQSIACGVTKNPWDLDRSVAGSSGGSGAAVASGMVPIATADDAGGSTRLPAASNGVVGFKYSRGRDSRRVNGGLAPLSNDGCHSRSIRDQAHFLNAREVKSGHLLEPVGLVTGPSTNRLRVAFTNFGIDEKLKIDPEVANQIEKSAKLLESLGHTVEEARFPIWSAEFWYHFMVYWTGAGAQITGGVQQALGRPVTPEDVDAWNRGLAENFKVYPDSAYEEAVQYFREMRYRYHEWMADYDIWLTPTSSEPADLNAQQDPTKLTYEALKYRVMEWDNFAPIGNAIGSPSITLPLGLSSTGLPVGSLLSGSSGSERAILQLAFELEEASPWKDRWPANSIVNL